MLWHAIPKPKQPSWKTLCHTDKDRQVIMDSGPIQNLSIMRTTYQAWNRFFPLDKTERKSLFSQNIFLKFTLDPVTTMEPEPAGLSFPPSSRKFTSTTLKTNHNALISVLHFKPHSCPTKRMLSGNAANGGIASTTSCCRSICTHEGSATAPCTRLWCPNS